MRFARLAQGFRHVAKHVAGAGVREGCKKVGRRGGFEEGRKRFVANFMSRKCYFAVTFSRGSYRTSYGSAQHFRGRRNAFEASN